jgi:hypothetical protein
MLSEDLKESIFVRLCNLVARRRKGLWPRKLGVQLGDQEKLELANIVERSIPSETMDSIDTVRRCFDMLVRILRSLWQSLARWQD